MRPDNMTHAAVRTLHNDFEVFTPSDQRREQAGEFHQRPAVEQAMSVLADALAELDAGQQRND